MNIVWVAAVKMMLGFLPRAKDEKHAARNVDFICLDAIAIEIMGDPRDIQSVFISIPRTLFN